MDHVIGVLTIKSGKIITHISAYFRGALLQMAAIFHWHILCHHNPKIMQQAISDAL